MKAPVGFGLLDLRRRCYALRAWTLVFAFASACATTYRPVLQRTARHEELALSLEALTVQNNNSEVDPGFSLLVRVERVPPGTTLVGAAVSDARSERCSKGHQATEVNVTGPRWTRPSEPLQARDVLKLRFAKEAWDDARKGPARLDMLLMDALSVGHCISFPLIDAAPQNRWEPDGKMSLGVGLAFEGFVRKLGDVGNTLTVPIMLGRFVGPVRVSATFAPGTAGCPRACPTTDKDRINNAPFLPASLGADTGWSFGRLRLGVGLSYRAAPTRVDASSGPYWELVHGPVLTPRLGFGPPDPLAPGLRGGERVSGYMGLDFPIALTFDNRGHVALGLGAALAWTFPM